MNDGLAAGFQADLVEVGVARLGHGLLEIEHAGTFFFPVAEDHIADGKAGGAVKFLVGGDGAALEGGQAGDGFESRAGGVSTAEGPGVERDGRVILQAIEFLGRNNRDENIGVEGGPGGEGEDFTGSDFKDRNGATLGVFFEDFLRDGLEAGINRGDDIISGDGWAGDALGHFFAVLVEGDVQDTGQAGELIIKDFFESLATLAIRKNEVAIFDGADGKRGDTTDIAEDVGGEPSLGVETEVGLAEDEIWGQALGGDGKLFWAEVLDQIEREQSAIFVVIEDGGFVDRNISFEELAGEGDLLAGEVENLLVVPIERGGEADGEIVAEAILGHGEAVAVNDLPSRGRDIKLESARLLLGFPSRFGVFHDSIGIGRCLGEERGWKTGEKAEGGPSWKFPGDWHKGKSIAQMEETLKDENGGAKWDVRLLIPVVVGLLAAVFLLAGDPWYSVQELMPGSTYRQYDELIEAAAEKHGVDPRLVKAVVWQESRFRAEAQGGAGERGLMQVMESAAADWVKATGVQTFQPTDLFDPKTNLEVGTWYLARALHRHATRDDPRVFALAEYNAGASRVQRWLEATAEGEVDSEQFRASIDFPKTLNYVENILARQRFYEHREEFGAAAAGPAAARTTP